LYVDNYKHVFLDEQQLVVSFPLYTLTGKLVGFQYYRPFADPKQNKAHPELGKYFPDVNEFDVPLWGTEKYDPHQQTCYLVEGIFDAVRFHNLGLNCLAVLCNNPKHARAQLKALGCRLVAVCDNDVPGRKLAGFADNFIICDGAKDPGDMTEQELTKFLQL
jgi:hypothetical protein